MQANLNCEVLGNMTRHTTTHRAVGVRLAGPACKVGCSPQLHRRRASRSHAGIHACRRQPRLRCPHQGRHVGGLQRQGPEGGKGKQQGGAGWRVRGTAWARRRSGVGTLAHVHAPCDMQRMRLAACPSPAHTCLAAIHTHKQA